MCSTVGCPSFPPSPHARKASSLPPPPSATRPALPPLAMKVPSAVLSATLVAFASGAAAQLSILTPGGPDLWWSESSKSLATPVETADAPLLSSCTIRQRCCLDMQDIPLHELHGFVHFTPLTRALWRRAQMLVRIANSDPKVLVAPQAFIAQQNNFDCSKLITKDQINLTPSTGYTIQLADPFNETHVSF